MEEPKEPFVDMENLKIGEIEPGFSKEEKQLVYSAQLETLEDIKNRIDFYKKYTNVDIAHAISIYVECQINEMKYHLQEYFKNK